MSRGWIRIFTYRCPEVELEFSFLGVQSLDHTLSFLLLWLFAYPFSSSLESHGSSGALNVRLGNLYFIYFRASNDLFSWLDSSWALVPSL